MPTERFTFPGKSGELDARLDLPDLKPRAYALFAHCFTCSKDSVAASRISRALAEQGIAVLRFDFTGLGGSEGDFGNTNFSSDVEDLLAAADHLRRIAMAPSILIGHSLGGTAVLAAADSLAEAEAVVTIGAPSDPAHVKHLFAEGNDDAPTHGEQAVALAGKRFVVRRQFLEDIKEHALTEKIRKLNKALLVMHSPRDVVVGIDQARRIYEAAMHPKSFVSLDDADHLLTRKSDAEYVATVVAAWASRYLPPDPEGGRPDTEPRAVVVSEAFSGGYAQNVHIGPHHMRGDEPETFGGDDTGPSPYDFLLAALGTCTSMTIRMYAQRKALPLEHVSVELRHQKIHAADCANCETKSGRIDRIQRSIRLRGPLDEGQRRRLLEIADKCPVHRTLRSEVVIETGPAQPDGGQESPIN